MLVSQKVMSSSLSQVRSNMPACATENAHTDTYLGCHGLTSREAPFEPSGYLVKFSVWGITMICGRIPLPFQTLKSSLLPGSPSRVQPCEFSKVSTVPAPHAQSAHSPWAGTLTPRSALPPDCLTLFPLPVSGGVAIWDTPCQLFYKFSHLILI